MTLAVGIVAETTNDVSNFADARKFAAWAGVAPGNNESAGKKKIKVPREFSKLLETPYPIKPTRDPFKARNEYRKNRYRD